MTDHLIGANILNKWKPEVPVNCIICNTLENIEHTIFRCKLASEVWKVVSNTLEISFSINNFLKSELPQIDETILDYTAFYIYKFWIETTNNRNTKTRENIMFFMKKNIGCLGSIEEQRKNYTISNKLKRISEKF